MSLELFWLNIQRFLVMCVLTVGNTQLQEEEEEEEEGLAACGSPFSHCSWGGRRPCPTILELVIEEGQSIAWGS